MTRRLALVLAICIALAGATALDAKGSSSRGSTSGKTVHVKGTKTSGTNRAKAEKQPSTKRQSSVRAAVARDSHGRIQRGDAARHAFARQTGYPSGRPGYVFDHIVPLACGGADDPSNMHWQTVAEAKARTERVSCR
jgi:hypothetical protein